ncbi:MAG: phosphotransferase [Myxococcota bacterium]|nr:phosphotransferase [Myxococcota bacterium]
MPASDSSANACSDELRGRLDALVLTQLGVSIESVESVAAGLGSRHFFRLQLSSRGTSAIARVDMPEDPGLRPPGVAAEPSLEPIRAHLEANGLPVPKRLAACDGIELLEDVGRLTLEDVAANGESPERSTLYGHAIDLIALLQRAPADTSVPNYERHLDATLLDYKAEQICSWLIPSATGQAATLGEREAVGAAFGEIRRACASAPSVLAHRDFKAQNLHVLAEGDPRGRLVMIDLQGAFLAPPEYDAVCLLRDLHVALPDSEVEALLARLWPQLASEPPEQDFKRRFNLLTLSRAGKDLSRFLFAVHERGDERYRSFLPNGVRSLKAAAQALGDEPCIADFSQILAALPEDACAR